MHTCIWWGAKLSKHLRPTAQPRSNVRLLPDDRGRSLRRNPVAQRNSQTHVCVLTSELRNLDDPKEDFLAKQYCSKHNCLSVSPLHPATLPDPLYVGVCVCVCVCVCEKWSFCWVAKCFQNKQASRLLQSCPSALRPPAPPVSWRSDSPGWSLKLLVAMQPFAGALSMPGKKKKKTGKRKGRLALVKSSQ